MTLKEIFAAAQSHQSMMHLAFQALGFIMLWLGQTVFFGMVPALFRVIPFIGPLLQAVGGFIVSFLTFFTSIVFFCVTVAIGWASTRRSKAITYLVLAVV